MDSTIYARQLAMPAIGLHGQRRLEQSSVLCIGAGGLGSSALYALAGAGIGTIGIVDADCVSASNFNRQFLYQWQDSNGSKAQIAAQRLRLFNPFIDIKPYDIRFSHEHADILADYDYILDCADNVRLSLLINDWCYHLGKPFISASISQFSGFLASFSGKSVPCLRCWHRLTPPTGEDCIQQGILGSVAATFGAMQATEVIRAIVSDDHTYTHALLIFDCFAYKLQRIDIPVDAGCIACNQRVRPQKETIHIEAHEVDFACQTFIDIRVDDSLPDLRQLGEFSHYLRLSAEQALQEYHKWQDAELVIICHRGFRSEQLVCELRKRGCVAKSLIAGAMNKDFCQRIAQLTCD